jgi:very-short-patch-repair endonuclease
LNDDRARDASLTVAGIPFLRFTYEQVVEQPAYVVGTLRTMLGPTSPP